MSDQIQERVSCREAARLSGMKYDTFRKKVECGHISTVPDPTRARGKQVRVADLGDKAQHQYLREKEEKALAEMKNPPKSRQPIYAIEKRPAAIAKPPQTSFHFEPQIPTQQAIDQAVAAVPASRRQWVQRWCEVVGMSVNGTWQKYKSELVGGRTVLTGTDFEKWLAEQNGVTHRDLRRKKAVYRSVEADPANHHNQGLIFKAFIEAILPKPRPGRTSVFQREGNEWMGITLINFYLNQAQYSKKRAHELLLEEIEKKQRAWKLGHYYERPTLRQCSIALEGVSLPEKILGRQGEKAYHDKCASYISRNPDSLRSSDIWVTDQKQIDVRLRGDGERLGRIWMVSFLDVRSFTVMGCRFGPVLSSDMVISAAAVAIGRHGVPKAIQMDLGKEFTCTAFSGGFRKIKGETLLGEAQGLCQRLGIDVIKAIGHNPQTKPIERWHRECARFDHRIPGWCGGNTQERPEVLAELERQHEEWKQGRRQGTSLWAIRQYIREFVGWAENEWNAQHRGRGKYLCGMTPNECWNTHLPPEGVRRITPAELDLATADHRVLKVARGGQINVTLYGQAIEYQAEELFLRQGERLEVIIRRGTLRRITVLDKEKDGRFLCEATAKPLFHWGMKTPEDREEMPQEIRMRNAAKKAIRRGNAARRLLGVTATPIDAGSQRPPMREASGVEFKSGSFWRMRVPKTRTSGELARRALKLQGE